MWICICIYKYLHLSGGDYFDLFELLKRKGSNRSIICFLPAWTIPSPSPVLRAPSLSCVIGTVTIIFGFKLILHSSLLSLPLFWLPSPIKQAIALSLPWKLGVELLLLPSPCSSPHRPWQKEVELTRQPLHSSSSQAAASPSFVTCCFFLLCSSFLFCLLLPCLPVIKLQPVTADATLIVNTTPGDCRGEQSHWFFYSGHHCCCCHSAWWTTPILFNSRQTSRPQHHLEFSGSCRPRRLAASRSSPLQRSSPAGSVELADRSCILPPFFR